MKLLPVALALLAVARTVPANGSEPARPPATVAEAASRQAAKQAEEAGATVPATTLATYRAAELATIQAGQADAALQAAVKSLRDYRAAFGTNPVGNNAEISKTLRGNNPRAARFAAEDASGASLSPKGEALDRWGNPLYFHPISATVMEVRSAGPDGKMWTADDLVAR